MNNIVKRLLVIILLVSPLFLGAQSKSKYPLLKAKQPTYLVSDKYQVEKMVSDTSDYMYRVKYYFPTINMTVYVFSSLINNGTGLMIKQGGKLLGNKSFKFISQLEDLPEKIEAADLDKEGTFDFIVRLKNNIGSSFGRQVHTTMYMFKKYNLYSYDGQVTVSFFPWKEYDTNNDGIYEIPCMDLVGIQQDNMFSLNLFQYEKGKFTNVGGTDKPYPRFYKYVAGDTILPTKVRKVKPDTRKYYISQAPMITYNEQ